MGSEDKGRGQGLARRLRAAIDARVHAQRCAEEEREARLAEARKARALMLRDLAGFGKALGHAKVTSTDDVVAIRYDGRSLRFEAVGDADEVRIVGDGLTEGYRLQHNTELGRWALHPPRGAPKLLFDAGLEDLVARVFELRPADEADPAPSSRPGQDSSPPGGGRTL